MKSTIRILISMVVLSATTLFVTGLAHAQDDDFVVTLDPDVVTEDGQAIEVSYENFPAGQVFILQCAGDVPTNDACDTRTIAQGRVGSDGTGSFDYEVTVGDLDADGECEVGDTCSIVVAAVSDPGDSSGFATFTVQGTVVSDTEETAEAPAASPSPTPAPAATPSPAPANAGSTSDTTSGDLGTSASGNPTLPNTGPDTLTIQLLVVGLAAIAVGTVIVRRQGGARALMPSGMRVTLFDQDAPQLYDQDRELSKLVTDVWRLPAAVPTRDDGRR